MKYNFSDWNNKQGTIPVQWKANDYQDLPWYENPDKDQGFSTPKENYDIYKERVGCLIPKFEHVGKGIFIPKDVDKIFGYVLDYFNLDNPVYAFAKYKPGLILPWHKDNYPTYARNKKAEVENLDYVERNDVKVFIDPKATMFLLGSEMDYSTDKLSSRFVFKNPNEKSTCGCGESFSV